jgi:hypothetical protein
MPACKQLPVDPRDLTPCSASCATSPCALAVYPPTTCLQVDAAWDAAVAALKGVLEPAFRGATAAAAMLTVKDFILLLCLALGAPSCMMPADMLCCAVLGWAVLGCAGLCWAVLGWAGNLTPVYLPDGSHSCMQLSACLRAQPFCPTCPGPPLPCPGTPSLYHPCRPLWVPHCGSEGDADEQSGQVSRAAGGSHSRGSTGEAVQCRRLHWCVCCGNEAVQAEHLRCVASCVSCPCMLMPHNLPVPTASLSAACRGR